MCSITGRFRTGTIGFGIAWVIGRSRVPSPAARTIAFKVSPPPPDAGANACPYLLFQAFAGAEEAAADPQ